MSKILFYDKYGITQAVLEERKTMTRRIINYPFDDEDELSEWGISTGGKAYITIYRNGRCMKDIYPKYQPGEEVAVAQCYEDARLSVGEEVWNEQHKWYNVKYCCHEAGLHNKMFVKAELMLHRIRITNIKVERLQDISDDDCFKEGIRWDYADYPYMNNKTYFFTDYEGFESPRMAFSKLINLVCGKGTWDRNPFCFCYEFELVNK